MDCKVENLINEAVISLDEAASVQQACILMAERNQGYLVVTREQQVVGLFTEQDLLRRVVAQGHPPDTISLAEVCSRQLVSINNDSHCVDAIRKMRANQCRRLMVYQGERFRGVVIMTDLANALAKQDNSNNFLVNLAGGVTLVVALGVIALLMLQLPDMLEFAQYVSNR